MSKRIYLSSPTMHGDEQRFVAEAFETNWVAPLGPNVDAFEKELCGYTGAPYAAALSSGTAAIHLAVRLLGIGEGDIVFCQSLTFSATCNPVAYEKGKVVFIDSEMDTWNMDPEALKLAYEKYPNPKAVIFVHLYGTPAKVGELMDICSKHGTPVIEDAAESLGASYQDKKTGTFGDFGIFSFNGNKIITTSGGGMLASRNEEAIQKARFLATQARDPALHYQHSQIGYNYRMSNVVAGIGRGQLLHLDEHIALKKKIYHQYQQAFLDIPQLHMNPLNKDGGANYWLSCIMLEEGIAEEKVSQEENPIILRILDALAKENIESRPIWKPLHLQPVFADADFITARQDAGERESRILAGRPYSNAEQVFANGLCLPSDIKNTEEEMEKIISILREQLK
ncbi:MAG: aminotransferase class I/II-fold pyridoxal phosphate-dependent enzyme [Lachnospiraceae bacterium]|nr:aminotransferase class I/II-fold pyridoxal phosphate-dependent enzyme [Lachnospiraceae bacterium]